MWDNLCQVEFANLVGKNIVYLDKCISTKSYLTLINYPLIVILDRLLVKGSIKDNKINNFYLDTKGEI